MTHPLDTIEPIDTPERMTRARKSLGLTQPELAERLGVYVRTIQRFESGEVAIDRRTDLAMRFLIARMSANIHGTSFGSA